MELMERQEMMTWLASGRQALVDAVSGVSERLAAQRPEPERWSILECVEHVAVVEGYLLSQIETAETGETMVNRKREALIRARATDRSRQVPAPSAAVPTGQFATLAAALEQFLESRARSIRFVEKCAADLRAQMTTHPLIGTVNCYEMLLMMAAHPQRHAEQIREVRKKLESPASKV